MMPPALSAAISAQKNKLVLWEGCPVDDQFSSPKQIRWSAALGKLLVANSTTVNFHIRNADLSFSSKYYAATVAGQSIDADSSNIFLNLAASSYIRKISLDLSTVTSHSVCASIRMIDASGDPDYIYVTSNNATDGHGVRKVRKSDMTVVASLLATGSGDGQFNNPCGVKYYNNFVWVADPSNSRIVKLNALDLSFVANYTSAWAYDLDTDGTNWFVVSGASPNKILKYDMSFTDATKTSVNCVAYSLTIIPDQSDGNGATLAITDNTNSHLARYKCSDLSQVGSDVGSSGDGSSSLFDPTFTTSKATTVTYTMDDGFTYTTPSGTSHALSWNGFAGYTWRNAGPHRCTVRVNGGLGLVTAIDYRDDSISSIRNFVEMFNCASVVGYSNTFALPLSDISHLATIITLYGSASGKLSDVRSYVCTNFQLANNTSVVGSLADLKSTLQTCYLYLCPNITPGSIAHLTAIRDLRIYSMGWNQAGVDQVLLSIPASSYATPVMNIGGTNAAPSNAISGWYDPLVTPRTGNSDENWQWNAETSEHDPLTGGAAIWRANHMANPWTVTFNGGESEASLLGNAIGTGEKSWTSDGGIHDEIRAVKFTAVAGTIGDMRIKCAGSGNIKVAIYSDNAGEPNSLLAYSNEVAVVAGWNTIQLNVQVALNATYYWLAYKPSASYNVKYISTGGTSRAVADVYENAWSNPFPVGAVAGSLDIAIAGWGLKVV